MTRAILTLIQWACCLVLYTICLCCLFLLFWLPGGLINLWPWR